MAAQEVIHFPFQAQLSIASLFPLGRLNVHQKRPATVDSKPGSFRTAIGATMTKSDAYTEIYLWNLNVDRLIRVLQRLELQSICTRQGLKACELRLEEIRAGLNAGFSENDGRA